MDEVRVSRTTVITFPNGPYASVKIEGESDLNEFPSKYFYDKNPVEHHLPPMYLTQLLPMKMTAMAIIFILLILTTMMVW